MQAILCCYYAANSILALCVLSACLIFFMKITGPSHSWVGVVLRVVGGTSWGMLMAAMVCLFVLVNGGYLLFID